MILSSQHSAYPTWQLDCAKTNNNSTFQRKEDDLLGSVDDSSTHLQNTHSYVLHNPDTWTGVDCHEGELPDILNDGDFHQGDQTPYFGIGANCTVVSVVSSSNWAEDCVPVLVNTSKLTPVEIDTVPADFTGSTRKNRRRPSRPWVSAYKCTYSQHCNMMFHTKRQLTKHLREHDPQPHKCVFCGKAFKEMSKRNRHYVVHTGRKDFKCDICGTAFSTRGNMLAHAKRLHKTANP
ncbi:hypothetical protein QR680_004585 [Steinernema hermaphroditum]|uniref:C2H2-type domain-containing protein n=1 Tax=Steinernema hermaphroditum TaxID=289476 RepID=A0AA39LU79_9BILA|nr:hypothetical protein QR680_004585 [Steinernema hermaphroditum]